MSSEQRVSLPWLPLAPLLAIPILGTSPERLELVVLGMQAIFLLMALRNPVWVLGALALSESIALRASCREWITVQTAPSFSILTAIPHFLMTACEKLFGTPR